MRSVRDDTARLNLILAGKVPYDPELVSRMAFTPPTKEPNPVARKQIGLKLDTDLLERVDQARGKQTRTAFIEQALETELRAKTPPERLAANPRVMAWRRPG